MAIAINPTEITGGSLVAMSDSGSVMEMANKLEEMKEKLKLVKQFFKEVMEKDVDYGIIPGTDKPALYQPGADKINALYNFSKVIADKEENKDYNTGHYDATVKVRLIHRGTGVLISEGEGSCSTRESKYHYRWVGERDVPKGVDLATLPCKEYENKTTGAKWSKYRIENEDLFSLWNTVLKMAVKRAYIAATLSGTGLSGIFSQEEDELDAWIEGETTADNAAPATRSAGTVTGIDKKDLSVTLNFGKFKGNTLGHVLDEDPSYLEWLAANAQADKVRKACANIVKAMKGAKQPDKKPQTTKHQKDTPGTTAPDETIMDDMQYPFPGDNDAPPEDIFDGGEPA
jgi:hypothetical protein